MTAHLGAVAAAFPPSMSQRDIWNEWFAARYADLPRARSIWQSAAVETRHATVDPRVEDVRGWSTARRMERYVADAVPLAVTAAARSLCAGGLRPAQIDLLVVASCTGYATPGVDLLVARELGMSPHLQRLFVGHMGCYAALPALSAAVDASAARGLTVMVLCVELTSLHAQDDDRDVDQVVSHALFSDAAAAFLIRPAGPGLRVVDVAATADLDHLGAMTWTVTDHGFRMGLSAKVPAVLARHVRPAVEAMLARHDLAPGDVAGWAIHPGGPRILDACARALEVDPAAMAPSRETLREHGNCSSGTVVLVLERVLATVPLRPGDHVVALAFGPGLTLYAALFQMT